ncbi:MAG: hypothetical protein J0M13_10895 [Candidatus Accumulibacter sp.]|nr:hypothetical protein [Candidatus Accumulibacter necessarius]
MKPCTLPSRHGLLARFEPEAVDGLALVALRLLDTIAATGQPSPALIAASFVVLDAARGDSSLIEPAVIELLSVEI